MENWGFGSGFFYALFKLGYKGNALRVMFTKYEIEGLYDGVFLL